MPATLTHDPFGFEMTAADRAEYERWLDAIDLDRAAALERTWLREREALERIGNDFYHPEA